MQGSGFDPALVESTGLQEFNEERQLPEHGHARRVIEFHVQLAAECVEQLALLRPPQPAQRQLITSAFYLHPLGEPPHFAQTLSVP